MEARMPLKTGRPFPLSEGAMLECKEVMDLLSTYLSGKLEPVQAQQVRLHLKACKSCPRVTNICGTWVLEERSRRQRRRATAPAA